MEISEQDITEELKKINSFTKIPLDLESKRIVLNSVSNRKGRVLVLTSESHKAVLLFRCLVYSCYMSNHVNFDSKYLTESSLSLLPMFVDFLNNYDFEKENKGGVLKDFETYRIKVAKCMPQSSGLGLIIRYVKAATLNQKFNKKLKDIELNYLLNIAKVKPASKGESKQSTLTQYFTRYTWLRRDDVGIGHELFSRLASPKSLMSSFRITIETTYLEIQKLKKDLSDFIEEIGLSPDDFSPYIEEVSVGKKYINHYQKHIVDIAFLTKLQKGFHSVENQERYIPLFTVVLSEILNTTRYDEVFNCFFLNQELIVRKKLSEGIIKYALNIITDDSCLFSLDYIRETFHSMYNTTDTVDMTPAELYLFTQLMASCTVQASDIPKLAYSNFQFTKRRNGKVTHIQSEYFKGRAKSYHKLRTVTADTNLAKCILNFLENKKNDKTLGLSIKFVSIGQFKGFSNKLFGCMDSVFRLEIEKNLKRESSSPVFLNAMTALLKNGKVDEKIENDEFFISRMLWGPSLVKNSSVHAMSDTFTPTQLMNYHSHTDNTERQSYLSEENEEWLNNCGLITRAVMQDISTNLFRASQYDREKFLTEFTQVSASIDSRRENVLSRMKLITGKDKGRVDDLGFTQLSSEASFSESGDLWDSLYLVDSAETVMKLKYYLEQVKTKHKDLMNQAPEFLLFSVLPTTEWVEIIFEQKRFKEGSVKDGEAMYKKYKDILPPLFSAQLKGN